MSPRTHLVLLGGAALYAIALPPFDLAAAGWVALAPLIVLASRLPPGRAAACGATAGFYMAWAVTWWLPQAIAGYFDASLLYGAATISVAYVLAVSSTWGVFAWATSRLASLAYGPRVVVLAAVWTALELVRGRILADPWALLGYTQVPHVGLIQIATVTGVYGISFVLALGNAALAVLVVGRGGAAAWRTAGGVAGAVGLMWLAGAAAVPSRTPSDAPEGGLRVAIVQPDVAPAHTWTRGYAERQLARTLRTTNESTGPQIDLLVWPENSVTLYPEHEPFVRRRLDEVARRMNADLILGAPRDAGSGVTNSVRLVRGDATWAHYDKQRLVPFAEAPVASGGPARAADPSPRHFLPGRRPGLLHGRASYGVSICHEILYPETIHPAVASGASVLVNIANDGWLDGGYGVASRQHFAMGVMRAVESRRFLVRAATRGVSGAVDPWGRVLASSTPSWSGMLAVDVSARTGLTPYVRLGDWFPALCTVIALVFLVGIPTPAPRRRLSVSVTQPV